MNRGKGANEVKRGKGWWLELGSTHPTPNEPERVDDTTSATASRSEGVQPGEFLVEAEVPGVSSVTMLSVPRVSKVRNPGSSYSLHIQLTVVFYLTNMGFSIVSCPDKIYWS